MMHYTSEKFFYTQIPRVPWPDVDSYTRRVDRKGNIIFYHFYGKRAVEQVVISPDGDRVKLTLAAPKNRGYKLYNKDFGKIVWEWDEFVTAEEFAEARDGDTIMVPQREEKPEMQFTKVEKRIARIFPIFIFILYPIVLISHELYRILRAVDKNVRN